MPSNSDGSFIEDLHNALAHLLYHDVVISSVWYLSVSKRFGHRFGGLLSALEELLGENT
jgi:hypothetical protein